MRTPRIHLTARAAEAGGGALADPDVLACPVWARLLCHWLREFGNSGRSLAAIFRWVGGWVVVVVVVGGVGTM